MVAAHLSIGPTGNWSGYVQKTSGTTVLDQGRTHNPVNEVADITETAGPAWATPGHDAAGNMTTVPNPASLGTGITVSYDAWNRAVELEWASGMVDRCRYDGLSRRIVWSVDVGGTHNQWNYFYNASWQILEQRFGTTAHAQPEGLQPQFQYVWSLRYIDAPVLRDRNLDQDGLCDDERLYYLGDANFNVTTLVDTGGEAVERYLYDPYGQATIYDGGWADTRSSSSYTNLLFYTGRERDPGSNFYYYRHRYYHPNLGRFLSRDPIELAAGDGNLYRYCGGVALLACPAVLGEGRQRGHNGVTRANGSTPVGPRAA